MRVLLVLPYSKAYQITPDLGLGYLASSLKRGNHAVEILDCVNKNINHEKLVSFIKEWQPDILGFKAFTKDVPAIRESIRLVKATNKSVITVVGGPHPSCTGIDFFRDIPEADFAFCGEGELSFPNLVSKLERQERQDLESISGLIWRNNGQIKANPINLVENLDDLPIPSWELMDPNSYPAAPQGFFIKSHPSAPIIASRGCPFSCTFCCGHLLMGKKVRYRSIANLIEEIKYLNKYFKVKEFHFEDDNLTLDRNYTLRMCEEILALDFKIFWALPQGVRLDTLDKELLQLMKKAGCYSFSVGIESGSQRILDNMKKQQTLEEIEEKVNLINSVGINVMGFFIIGYPTETREDIDKTIRFARKVPLTYASFNIFKPYPGTEIYYSLKKNGELKNLDFSTFNYDEVSWTSKDFTVSQLKKLQKKATLNFYLRPGIFFAFLAKIRTLSQVKFLIKRVFSVILKS